MIGNPVTPSTVPQSPCGAALGTLRKEHDALADAIAEIEKRLAPVLDLPPPQTDASQTGVNPQSELHGEILDAAERAHFAYERLRSLINRLTV